MGKEWDPEPVTQALIGVDHGITKMTTITRGLSLQNVAKSLLGKEGPWLAAVQALLQTFVFKLSAGV